MHSQMAKIVSKVPTTMRSLASYTYVEPSDYQVLSIPTPGITVPHHILIKAHVASFNPADLALARGRFKMVVDLP